MVTDSALDKLARDGYDPAFGARPLKRVIQRELGDRLATAILEGRAADGDTITVDSPTATGGTEATDGFDITVVSPVA